MAVFYCLGEAPKAIRMGEELLHSLERHKSELKTYRIIRIQTALNLSCFLEEEQRYKEALMYIQMAEELSYEGFEQGLLPEIEFSKAKLCHMLGDDAGAETIIRAIVPYMELTRRNDFAAHVRGYAEENLGITV